MLLAGLVACNRRPAPAPPATTASSKATSGGVSSAASGKVDGKPRRDAAVSGDAAASPFASELSPPPASEEKRAPSGGNTRGVIQCGDASCTPGKQACVDASGWKCFPADAAPQMLVTYFCDDGTDCPAGETCCLGFESGVEEYRCSKRRGAETNCRMEICAEGGARCPKGQACEQGTCRAPDRAVTCGNAGRCPKERPLCLFSQGREACGTHAEYDKAAQIQAEPAALSCSRPADGGPEARCCTNALYNTTRCLTNCDEANEGDVCSSDADCTMFSGKPKKGKCVSLKDREIASLPAWLRVCAYDL